MTLLHTNLTSPTHQMSTLTIPSPESQLELDPSSIPGSQNSRLGTKATIGMVVGLVGFLIILIVAITLYSLAGKHRGWQNNF